MKARSFVQSMLLTAFLPLLAGMFLSGCGGEPPQLEEDPNPEEAQKFAEDYQKQMQKEMESQQSGGKEKKK